MANETHPVPTSDQTPAIKGEGLSRQMFRVSPGSEKMQRTGQIILASADTDLREVEENLFSTCLEPVEDFSERLFRARDLVIPLVEVTVLPQEMPTLPTLRNLFGVEAGRLAVSVIHADGLEFSNRFSSDKRLKYTSAGLSIPGLHQLSLGGGYGSEVTSVLTLGGLDYPIDRQGQPIHTEGSFGGTDIHEAGSSSSRFDDMVDEVLGRSLRDFSIATRLEKLHAGVVPATQSELMT